MICAYTRRVNQEYFDIFKHKIQSIDRKKEFLQITKNKAADIEGSIKVSKETLENLEELLNNEKSQLEELEKNNLSNYEHQETDLELLNKRNFEEIKNMKEKILLLKEKKDELNKTLNIMLETKVEE